LFSVNLSWCLADCLFFWLNNALLRFKYNERQLLHKKAVRGYGTNYNQISCNRVLIKMIQRNNLFDTLAALYYCKGATLQEINLFGVRRNGGNSLDDKFVDMLGIMTASGDVFTVIGTTIPGRYWTENPVTWRGITGAAHVVPGFYKNLWCVGIHGAKYPDFKHTALIQVGPVAIYRDTDKDGAVSTVDPVQTSDEIGIDFHRASKAEVVENIGLYGAGCQVVPDKADFDALMSLILSSQMYKDCPLCRFSYLLLSSDIIEVS
jgi:hypothetical protein